MFKKKKDKHGERNGFGNQYPSINWYIKVKMVLLV